MSGALTRIEAWLAARAETRAARGAITGRPDLVMSAPGPDGHVDLLETDIRTLADIARSVTGIEHG